ncbi:MAG: hypothetical protein JW889_08305, partial [Verrucomicrobia bacterium]|nr:hypothetical protein [Verrucomicrobiota bacterium]
LIDGDPETCWCSRAQIEPDFEPVWIRIDLPAEAEIGAIRLVPHKQGMRGYAPIPGEPEDTPGVGQGLPRKLTVKVSRDAHHWDVVYENDELAADPSMEPIEIRFDGRRAKQIWIIGENLPDVLGLGHAFSVSGVEVLDTEGTNLALHSRGAGVTVSSTHLGYGMDRFTQDMLWPIQYDLGFKWTRVGYDMSALQWAYVEREKGVLAVDPRTDAAITEAVEHGLEVILVLDKGNWLHAPEPRVPQRNRELMETYYNLAPWPDFEVSPEYYEAWLNYVRYMVRHFKDRVRYFEIWNEWSGDVDGYCRLAERTARVIREEYPEARIVLNSTSSVSSGAIHFIVACIERMKGLFTVVGVHPYYNTDPQEIREYPRRIARLKGRLAKLGFDGEIMATEWSWFASYPPADRDERYFTEMQKAKIAARFMTTNVALGIPSFWNETFQTHMTSRDVSLLRNTFSGDPISPTQPQPIYYALRTLSTALEDVKAVEAKVEFTPGHEDLEWYVLERGNGDLVIAVWLAGVAVDDASREHVTDIRLPGTGFKAAEGIDSLNGMRHKLNISPNADVLKAIHVRDWPLIIVLGKGK